MTPFSLSGLLAGVTSLSVGFFVLLKSPNRRIGRIWFLFTLSVAGWGFGSMWIGYSKTPNECLHAFAAAYIFGVIWIAPLFHHFVRIFLELKNNKSITIHYL